MNLADHWLLYNVVTHTHMSVPNHHQQKPKRDRSPPGPPDQRDQAASTPAPRTKSPHTDKIIKRSRTDGTYSPQPAPRDVPPPILPTHTKTNPTKLPLAAGKPRPTTNLNPVSPPFVPAGLLVVLNAQLDALMTIVSQITKLSTLDPSLPEVHRTQTILSSIANHISQETPRSATPAPSKVPPTNPQNPTPSYADATKATTCTPARGHTTKPAQRKKQVDKTAAPSTHHRHSPRVIVDFHHSEFRVNQGDAPKVTPLAIRTYINGLLCEANVGLSISTVVITSTGNVILTPTPPYTVSQFLADGVPNLLVRMVATACKIDLDPTEAMFIGVYEDTPWHRVVIHGIPKESDETETNWVEGDLHTELQQYNPTYLWPKLPIMDRHYRVLCRKEDWSQREVVSVCCTFPDGAMARQAIRNGLAVFGAHCRVSPYRPSSKAQTPTTAAC